MIQQRYSVTPTGPAGDEPVTWSELADHSRIDSTGERPILESLISRARELAEIHTRRAITLRSYRLWLDEFPAGGDALELPRPKLQDVSRVEYVDGDGDVTTWDSTNWQFDQHAEPGQIKPTNGRAWPTVHSHTLNAARIDFTAGWTPEEVPERVKHAILMLAAHWYEHREAAAERVPQEIAFSWRVLLATAETGELW